MGTSLEGLGVLLRATSAANNYSNLGHVNETDFVNIKVIMAEFKTELFISLKPGSDKIYVLTEPLIFQSNVMGLIEVPAGFNTDFASVPRLPLIYAVWGDRAHREAVLHDYLYRIDAIPLATYRQSLIPLIVQATCRPIQ